MRQTLLLKPEPVKFLREMYLISKFAHQKANGSFCIFLCDAVYFEPTDLSCV